MIKMTQLESLVFVKVKKSRIRISDNGTLHQDFKGIGSPPTLKLRRPTFGLQAEREYL